MLKFLPYLLTLMYETDFPRIVLGSKKNIRYSIVMRFSSTQRAAPATTSGFPRAAAMALQQQQVVRFNEFFPISPLCKLFVFEGKYLKEHVGYFVINLDTVSFYEHLNKNTT